MDKYEYLTGEGLGLRPSTIEETKFEYSSLCKIFNKGLSKDDEKDGLFKRLKNIEGENKKESESIKNEEQWEVMKDESTVADEKPIETVLLTDNLYFELKNLAQILIILEKKFLKKLPKDEKKIDYNNLFFEIDSNSVLKSVDFLQEIDTLFDLLIYLFNNSMKIITFTETQIDFFKAITVLRIIISNMKSDIADQSEEEKKKIFAEKENISSNVEMLLKKRGELIGQFSKNEIISIGEIFYGAPKKS